MSDITDLCVLCKPGFEESSVTVKVYEKGLRTFLRVSKKKEHYKLHR